MSRTIRTPKIYRSRREFIKAVSLWARNLDFAPPSPLADPITAHNANPFLCNLTTTTPKGKGYRHAR